MRLANCHPCSSVTLDVHEVHMQMVVAGLIVKEHPQLIGPQPVLVAYCLLARTAHSCYSTIPDALIGVAFTDTPPSSRGITDHYQYS